MKHRNCTICGKPIVLVPSAADRAKKYGGKPQDYLNLFKQHDACVLAKRNADTMALLKRSKGA